MRWIDLMSGIQAAIWRSALNASFHIAVGMWSQPFFSPRENLWSRRFQSASASR